MWGGGGKGANTGGYGPLAPRSTRSAGGVSGSLGRAAIPCSHGFGIRGGSGAPRAMSERVRWRRSEVAGRHRVELLAPTAACLAGVARHLVLTDFLLLR